jgi:hypothetical protein
MVQRLAVVYGSIMLTACAVPPSVLRSAAPPATPAVCTQTDAQAAPRETGATLAALRRSVETGPLYAAAADASGVAPMCRVHHDPDRTVLEYRFRDGAALRMERDARIEYTSQEAWLVRHLPEPAANVLTRAERAAFGVAGCGIDWQHPETRPADGNTGATDTIFRGTACNCQARVRRNVDGRVAELALRSTC